MPMRGISRFSKETLLSHSTEKLRRETILLITNIMLSKNFMDKRWGMKQGGVSRYSVRKILSQNTENLRREHFCASLISGV